MLRERDERGHSDEEVLSVYRDLGVVRKRDRTDNFNKTPEDLSNYKLVLPGDVVVNKMKAWQGSIAVSRYRGIVSGDYMVCEVTADVDRAFLHNLLRSRELVAEYAARAKGIRPAQWRLYWDEFADIRVVLPARDEQVHIGETLSRKTRQIDGLVESRNRMLELLRDRFVSMRRAVFDGQISATGDIALRRCIRCLDGARIPLNAEERASRRGEFPYWGTATVVDRIDDYLFDEPLVLLGEDGAPFFDDSRDVAFYVDEPVWVNNHIHVLRPLPGWSPRFLMHMLNAVDFGRYITGSTRDKLTQAEMDGIRLPRAPLGEQERVAAELDALELRTKAVRKRLERQIDLLRERRQTLITAAVTGQLDVAAATG